MTKSQVNPSEVVITAFSVLENNWQKCIKSMEKNCNKTNQPEVKWSRTVCHVIKAKVINKLSDRFVELDSELHYNQSHQLQR